MEKGILLCGVAALLMSCGGDKSAKVTPETTEIKGPLKGCYEVVQKDYTIQTGSWSDILNVELRRTEQELPFDPQRAITFSEYGDDESVQVGFGLELLDKNGDVVEVFNANAGGLSGAYSSDDIEAAIWLNSGETGIVRWSVDVDNKPVSFRITSAVNSESGSGYAASGHSTSSADNAGVVSKTESSNDWDKVLDEYERYVDKYVAMYTKAMQGDISAMTEYGDLLEAAEEFADELDNASDDMSSAQLSRYMRITNKLSSATVDALGL